MKNFIPDEFAESTYKKTAQESEDSENKEETLENKDGGIDDEEEKDWEIVIFPRWGR